ncbi:hypothetical protein REC12_09340 [Desulfosporosinus sp. PR]|nr:hypothetical protein [Desulfosporosinus sp. PR]MDQ7093795.1 hypothetical protein [Desulfosporosinus sp. PR]
MKKKIAFLLVLILLCTSLAGCGNSNSGAKTAGGEPKASSLAWDSFRRI